MRLFYKYLSVILGCCVAFGSASAQKKTLHGTITNKQTGQTIMMASVRNVLTGNIVISNRNGQFYAQAEPLQVMAFSANGFYTDTITISPSQLDSGMAVQLRPLPSTLADVTVSAGLNRYQRDSMERRREFLQTVGENRIPAVGHTNDMGFGIAVNLDHFKKSERNKRQVRNLFEILEEDAYINYRWDEVVVVKYTGYTGDQLDKFMQQYRPGYEWLRKNQSDEDLKYYINDKLKKFKKQNPQ